jgi:hypothetical protein
MLVQDHKCTGLGCRFCEEDSAKRATYGVWTAEDEAKYRLWRETEWPTPPKKREETNGNPN